MGADDTSSAPFTGLDWGLVAAIALMWGSSFLLIAEGLDHLGPGLVAGGRILVGALVLGALRSARRPVAREDWPGVVALGACWMGVPLLLFAFAERHIASSLAGMLNGAAPLWTAALGLLIWRRRLTRRQVGGLLLGFAGVVAVSWPALQGSTSTTGGALLVVAATALYGIAFNLAGPLQRRNGALPVLWRAQLVALVLVAPFALADLPDAEPASSSLLAIAALGALGTGAAFVAATELVGRVGAARGSLPTYLVPVVAAALGAAARDERIAAISLVGVALVILGAWRASRV